VHIHSFQNHPAGYTAEMLPGKEVQPGGLPASGRQLSGLNCKCSHYRLHPTGETGPGRKRVEGQAHPVPLDGSRPSERKSAREIARDVFRVRQCVGLARGLQPASVAEQATSRAIPKQACYGGD